MIRTVPIPTKVSRMGCAPGGDCCDSCSGHTMGAIHTNRIRGARNMALHSTLADVQCDSDGNCYTNGVLTSAPLTTGSGCAVGDPTCTTSTSTSTWLYLGAGLIAIALLEATSRRR